MHRRHGSGLDIRERLGGLVATGVLVTTTLAVAVPAALVAAPVAGAQGVDPAESSETTAPTVPSTTAPSTTTSAPATTTTTTTGAVTVEPTAPAPTRAEESEEVAEPTTTVADEVEEEPATTTTVASTSSSAPRRAPAPSTSAAVPTTTEAPRTAGGSIGSTREEAGSDDDSQAVVRLVIGLLVVVALVIATLTWRYWRFTDPRRGYAPSRARLPRATDAVSVGGRVGSGDGAVLGGTAGATRVGADPVGVGTSGPEPGAGTTGAGAAGEANGGRPQSEPAGARPQPVSIGAGGSLGGGPTSVFEGMELHGAGRATLAEDVDPTDPGPGSYGVVRQPERVGGPEPAPGDDRPARAPDGER